MDRCQAFSVLLVALTLVAIAPAPLAAEELAESQLKAATVDGQIVITAELNGAAKAIIASAKAYATENGSAPTLTRLYGELSSPPGMIDWLGYAAITQAYGDLQKPPISSGDLVKLFRNKREALNSLEYKSRIVTETFGPAPRTEVENHEFLMDGSRIMLASEYGKRGDPRYVMRAFGFDGTNAITYQNDGSVGGSIVTSPRSRDVFFLPDNLLMATFLFDSENDLGGKVQGQDIAAITPIIWETEVEWQGSSCYMLGGVEYHLYLDPTLDFAVIGVEESPIRFDDKAGRIVPTETSRITVNSQFSDFGNGIFLPRRSVTEWKHGDQILERRTISFANVSVNKSIDARRFDPTPDGAAVLNQVTSLGYRKGDETSASPLFLEDAVNSLRPNHGSRRIWLLAINLAIVATLIVVFCTRRLKARRQLGGDVH